MQVSSIYRCVLDFLYAKGQMSASCVTSRECIANRWLQVLLLRLRLESRKSPGRRCLRRSRLVLPLWLTCEEPYRRVGSSDGHCARILGFASFLRIVWITPSPQVENFVGFTLHSPERNVFGFRDAVADGCPIEDNCI